jgi:hypothetical protein
MYEVQVLFSKVLRRCEPSCPQFAGISYLIPNMSLSRRSQAFIHALDIVEAAETELRLTEGDLRAAPSPAACTLPTQSQMRSVFVARAMMKGAVWAVRQETQLCRDPRRIVSARENLLFWRKRLRGLMSPGLRGVHTGT